MSPLSPNQLTVRKIETIKADGSYADGGNLWLLVQRGARSWTFRYLSATTSKRREMGLGAVRDPPLAAARVAASGYRKMLAEGEDLIEQRKAVAAAAERGPYFPVAGTTIRQMVLTFQRYTNQNPATLSGSAADLGLRGLQQTFSCSVVNK